MASDIGRNVTGNESNPFQDEDAEADALLASLEEDDDAGYRAQRMQELRTEAGSLKPNATVSHDATYLTLKTDDDTLRFTIEHERAIVHFFHPDFARCSTMDTHLEKIALKHLQEGAGNVAFARADVNQIPFLVEKLSVRILPCVIGFVDGVVKGRITGFEGLCWDGNESSATVTKAVEKTLIDWTVLKKRLLQDDESDSDSEEERRDTSSSNKNTRRGIKTGKFLNEDDNDDWD